MKVRVGVKRGRLYSSRSRERQTFCRTVWIVAKLALPAILRAMSLNDLKSELAALPRKERRHLMGYLVELEHRDDPAYREMLARKIDDRDPAHWVSEEELDARLNLPPARE